jgi:hypothetical protein
MSDMIRYQYGANYDSLASNEGLTNESVTMREEASKVISALDDVYEGQAKAELQTRSIQILDAMDAVLAEIRQSLSKGNQSQEDARALDAHLAGGF